MSFFEELKRRNVVRVGIAYVLIGWLVLQGSDFALDLIDAPNWVIQAFSILVIAGLPIALFFAWAFELTPEGIKREHEVDRTQSITPGTGRKLDYAIIALLGLGLVYFFWESRFSEESPTAEPAATPAVVQSDQATEPAAPAMNPNSIAVLPFANRSAQSDDQYFSDGIHDDLLTQLAKIDDLKVISRTSVMEYRDTTKKIPDIASELGVTKILEGGVQRAGKRIRINAQLIDVETDEHLWAETFDREMTLDNVFDIQSEITRQIVQAVRGELTEEEKASLDQRPTHSIEAWEAYIQARASFLRPDYLPENYIAAEPWARRATELDPEFAEAWAMLAMVSMQAVWMGYDDTPERRLNIRQYVDRAMELAPESSQTMAAQADYLYRIDLDYEGAHIYYQKALALTPGDSHLWLFQAITERRLGLWDQSIESFQRALDLDPANQFIATQLMDTLQLMNDWERVAALSDGMIERYPTSVDLKCYKVQALVYLNGDLESARTLMDLIPPSNSGVYFGTAQTLASLERDYPRWIEVLQGPGSENMIMFTMGGPRVQLGFAHDLNEDQEEARWQFENYLRDYAEMDTTGDRQESFKLINDALSYAGLGDMASALAAAEASTGLLNRDQDHLFGAITHNAQTWIMALAGQRDEALLRLAENIDAPEGYTRWQLRLDPMWDFFRDDPRFNELIGAESTDIPRTPKRTLGDGT